MALIIALVSLLPYGHSFYIIWLNCRNTYVDAAYCYRPSSVVCRSVTVTVVSAAKTAEAIDIMPFWLRTRITVGRRNHILDGVHIPHENMAILRGRGWPIVKYRDTLRSCVQNG